MVVSVCSLLTCFDLGLVAGEVGGVEGGVEVLGVDTDRLGTLLTETEGSDGEGFDAVGLDALVGVDNVPELSMTLSTLSALRLPGMRPESRTWRHPLNIHDPAAPLG